MGSAAQDESHRTPLHAGPGGSCVLCRPPATTAPDRRSLLRAELLLHAANMPLPALELVVQAADRIKQAGDRYAEHTGANGDQGLGPQGRSLLLDLLVMDVALEVRGG